MELMKLLIIIFHSMLFFFSYTTCKALDIYQFIDTRAQAMGNTMSVLPGFANPAGYGCMTLKESGLYYLNRYGVKEFSTYAVGVNIPNSYLNTGLYVSRYGFTEYNQLQIGTNVYKKLAEYLVLGIRLTYVNFHYSGTEHSRSLFSGDIGVLIYPVDQWSISVLAINPFRADIKIAGEKAGTSGKLIIGTSYQIDENFLITGEVEKDFIYPFIGKLGIEYKPIKGLRIRAGMFGKPFTPTFGLGLHLHSFVLNLSFNRHPVLGNELGSSLHFNF